MLCLTLPLIARPSENEHVPARLAPSSVPVVPQGCKARMDLLSIPGTSVGVIERAQPRLGARFGLSCGPAREAVAPVGSRPTRPAATAARLSPLALAARLRLRALPLRPPGRPWDNSGRSLAERLSRRTRYSRLLGSTDLQRYIRATAPHSSGNSRQG